MLEEIQYVTDKIEELENEVSYYERESAKNR